MSKKNFGDDLIAKGENPNGCIAQTADGTLRNYDALGRQEYKWNQGADGPRWNNGFDPKPGISEVPPNPSRKRR
jgi:hypothetical protein